MVNMTEIKKKICLLGDAGVGKTSLIRKFVLDQFDDEYISTLGTKITKKRMKYSMDTENIIDLFLMIWDIMGQKEFRKSQMMAFADSKAAIIVCDITRRETLANITSWHDDLLKITGKIPILILANKNDLIDQAQFAQEDLTEVAEQLSAPAYFSSAKTGENVDWAFKEIGSKLI